MDYDPGLQSVHDVATDAQSTQMDVLKYTVATAVSGGDASQGIHAVNALFSQKVQRNFPNWTHRGPFYGPPHVITIGTLGVPEV